MNDQFKSYAMAIGGMAKWYKEWESDKDQKKQGRHINKLHKENEQILSYKGLNLCLF